MKVSEGPQSLILLCHWEVICQCQVRSDRAPYLTGLQSCDAFAEPVRHSFWDHGIQEGVASFLLLVQLLNDLLELGILLLFLW